MWLAPVDMSPGLDTLLATSHAQSRRLLDHHQLTFPRALGNLSSAVRSLDLPLVVRALG